VFLWWQGAILQRVVREAAPRNAVEVGTMCGYSTILMAQALEKGVLQRELRSHTKHMLAALSCAISHMNSITVTSNPLQNVSCAGARLVSFEKAFQWAMAGKRFLWQVRRALLGAAFVALLHPLPSHDCRMMPLESPEWYCNAASLIAALICPIVTATGPGRSGRQRHGGSGCAVG
jgi:hypothetical protein